MKYILWKSNEAKAHFHICIVSLHILKNRANLTDPHIKKTILYIYSPPKCFYLVLQFYDVDCWSYDLPTLNSLPGILKCLD